MKSSGIFPVRMQWQAFSSSNLIGSDHRMVSKVRLSVRRPQTSTNRLYWHYLSINKTLSNRIDNAIYFQYNNIQRAKQSYSSFVTIANKVGSDLLSERERSPPSYSSNAPAVVSARKANLRFSSTSLQTTQTNLRNIYDKCEDKRINETLRSKTSLLPRQ